MVVHVSEPVFTPIPDGLAEMTPGPALGAVLAGIDRARLNGHQLVLLLRARSRQLSWEQAQLLADLHELAYTQADVRSDVPPTRRTSLDPHAAEEAAFALSWTSHAADGQIGLAIYALACQPAVHAALAAGRIDLAKVNVICDETGLLDEDQATTVIEQVLPEAQFKTTGTLRHQIRRLVLKIDPDAVRKRHQAALEDRAVIRKVHKDGTCSLSGYNLPADKVAAAWDYLCRTATATKRANQTVDAPTGPDRDTRTADQIRADLFLDLLAGADPTVPAAQGGAGAANPAPRQGVISLGMELETLLHLNDHPAELAGLGPIVADMARQTAAHLREFVVWRFHVTQDGRVVHEGRLHRRPTADQIAYVRARDRHCQAPGCRRPAHQCEIDHTTRWDDNGPTQEWNLATACKRHHRAKDTGGFQLYRTDFGLLWVSPRGHAHPVTYGRELNTDQRRMLQQLIDRCEHIKLRR
jgi:Domain of unknown function (DUF222)/HNH endonuclease